MNATLPDDDVSIHYYDSDYPSSDHGKYPENFDDITILQGVAHDVERYLELAKDVPGDILEIGCGTGRVAIPLARAGHRVTCVDASKGMLQCFRTKLKSESDALNDNLTLVHADATSLSLGRNDFELALIPFNTLPCIPDFQLQRQTLVVVASHLRVGGQLVLDLINPYKLRMEGDQVPKPFFTRRNVWTGHEYTRFAMMGPMDDQQRQQLLGWYDEVSADGFLVRRRYSITWRPLFRYEIALMLETAGFEIESIEGGHLREPFNADSPKMFIAARRI